MRQQIEGGKFLDRATAAFEASSGLRCKIVRRTPVGNDPGFDAVVEVAAAAGAFRFPAVVKPAGLRGLSRASLVLMRLDNHATAPTLLVSPYVNAALAAQCRTLHVPFMDEAGNAYLEAPGLFVYVTGRPRTAPAEVAPSFRALTPAGLRIVFALLHRPELAAATYRDIALAAKVALGSVGEVLADLERRGMLAPDKPGPRRLLDRARLQDEWATHFPVKLRPKLHPRRFTATTPDWWRGLDIRQFDAWWGGEVAADRLTGNLKPASVTVYVAGKPDRLILANRLRADAKGEIEILDAFWPDGGSGGADSAPPLVVYADLLASADPRNIETARMIRDQSLG